MEIERRWVSLKLPKILDGIRNNLTIQGTQIIKLSEDSILRYRYKLGSPEGKITIKKGTGLSRVEIEQYVKAEEIQALMDQSKTAYGLYGHIEVDDVSYDIKFLPTSVLNGEVVWTWIVEVEFDNENDAKAFIPSFDMEEVTYLDAWNYQSIYEQELLKFPMYVTNVENTKLALNYVKGV